MDLSDLPQFMVKSIAPGPAEYETRVTGHLSHLRGVHNQRGWLYRSDGPSIIGDLVALPTSPGAPVDFVTPDASLAPELQPGTQFPWLDGYWEPYQLAMILAPTARWTRTTFVAGPAQYFELNGVTGWQPLGLELPAGATARSVRPGGWDHEHCELCNAHIGAAGASEGYVDTDGNWLCVACYDRYAAPRDIAFATEP